MSWMPSADLPSCHDAHAHGVAFESSHRVHRNSCHAYLPLPPQFHGNGITACAPERRRSVGGLQSRVRRAASESKRVHGVRRI